MITLIFCCPAINFVLKCFVSNHIINCYGYFYIPSKRLLVKCKILSDARVGSLTKKWFCSTFFVKIQSVNRETINCNLLKLFFVSNFHNKTECRN